MRNSFFARSSLLRRLIKLHVVAFTVFLGVYFVLAFFDPGLLSYDLRQKFRALADETITVTATVLDVPAKPVVTVVADCNETTGVLSVALDWTTDVNSYTYDAERDSLPLVSGLTNSAYTDTNVVVNTTYEYVVTGNGPMGPGFATSDPVSVTTPAECEITAAPPAVTIVSFAGRGVDAYDGKPRVKNRQPLFTGTTSMPNATLIVTIGQSFSAQFSASSTGYWEWRPPQSISFGSHTFAITATDPNDSTRTATATLRFDRLKPEDSDKNSSGSGKRSLTNSIATAPVRTEVRLPGSEPPLQFSLVLPRESHAVPQGGSLNIRLTLDELADRYTHIEVPIRFSVLDENRRSMFFETRSVVIEKDGVIDQDLVIPMYLEPGRYFVQVEILLDTLNISRTESFQVRETPLIQLASGKNISYADVVRNLGWVLFSAVIGVFSWLTLLLKEGILTLRAKSVVLAEELLRAGLIRK